MHVTQVKQELAKAIKAKGSLRKWAEANNLSPAFVSDVMRGNRRPSKNILAPLGLERIDREPVYRRKNGAKT